MEDGNPLLGTWSLVAWYNQTRDGQKLHPLGRDATGHICYSSDGYVFVQISAANRVPFALGDPFGGTMAEDSAAMKSQITYAGTFEYHGSHVVHHVTQSCCPNWVGTEQVRQVKFENEGLRLSAAGAIFQGQEVTAYVDWKRAKP